MLTKIQNQSSMQSDIQRQEYAKCRHKVRNAISKVDRTPMPINIAKYLGFLQMPMDYAELKNSIVENKRLFNEINNENMKLEDQYSNCLAARAPSALMKAAIRRARRINKQNLYLAQRLEKTRSIVNTGLRKSISPTKIKKQLDVLQAISNKFSSVVELPKSIRMQDKMFRPKVFFDLMLKNDRSYGRIVFQLHTEVCPALVLEFLRFCATGECVKLQFPNLYSPLWLEAAMLTHPNNWDYIHYDINAFRNSAQSGILFFALQDFDDFKRGTLLFSISFRPITVVDMKRFAFGKVLSGKNNFACLKENGTKGGKPKREIIVTSMGVLDS